MSNHNHDHTGHKVTTLDLIKRYLDLKIRKMTGTKLPIINPNESMINSISPENINHIAILLDSRVQDVIRAQNRFAALLLSEPVFVEFDPETQKVEIDYLYSDGNFINDTDAQ